MDEPLRFPEGYILFPRRIPALKHLAAAAYHPDPVPTHWHTSDLVESLCTGALYSMVLERRASPEVDHFLWAPPRYNPWQWRVVCLKPIETGFTTVGIVHMDGSRSSHIHASREGLQELVVSMNALPHLIPIEAHWFNGADLQWPEELIHMNEPPQDGLPTEQVQDTLEEMQRMEEHWHQQDASDQI